MPFKVAVLLPLLVVQSFAWAWAPIQGKPAPKVSGHACCETGEGALLLFGGLKPDRTATNQLWVFECDTGGGDGQWKRSEVQNQADGPGPRMYAAAAKLGDTVFVIGGWDPEAKGSGGSFKDEVFGLDTKSMWWKAYDPLPCGPISRHTACTVGSKVIVHTYRGGDEGILVLNSDGVCHPQATEGPAPTGISMCAATALDEHTLLIFGGSDKNQAMSESVYVLDTKAWQWRKLQSRGEAIPTARASPCMARVDDATCVVFGGAGLSQEGYEGGKGLRGSDETWILKVDGSYADWTLLRGDNASPPARVAATLSEILTDKRKFLLAGGWDPATAETFEEPWTLEM